MSLKIAVIGCGGSGYNHLKNFLAEPEVEGIVAVDINRHRLDEIAKRHNIEVSTDYREVIKDKDIDAVVIATSNEAHPAIAIESMKAGKHVFCKKPIGPTLDECGR